MKIGCDGLNTAVIPRPEGPAINSDHQGLSEGFRTRLGAKCTEFCCVDFSCLLPFPVDPPP
jgi:hypothetical protein